MEDEPAHPLASVRIEAGIAHVEIDIEGESVNTLSTPMTDRFEEIVDGLRHETGLKGAVISSGKPDNFIAGFDLEELRELRDDPASLRTLIERGHRLMDDLERLDIPVVAAIDGECLGGGLEVALACSGRIASDREATTLGAPEVKLGLIPGLGGTQRLPRLINPQTAVRMMLTGEELGAERAEREGLVDEVVHPGIVRKVAAARARELHRTGDNGADRTRVSISSLQEIFADPTGEAVKLVAESPARRVMFEHVREMAREQSGDHYPAPFRAIDVVETGFRDGFEAGIEAETDAFVELAQTDVSRNLTDLFFMQRELETDPGVAEEAQPRDVDKIGVLGAGLMGAGIAQLAAYEDYAVRLKDRDFDGLGWGMDYCRGLFDDLVEKGKLTEPMADVRFGNISGTTDYTGFDHCDLVVEAVFEDLALKQSVLEDVESRIDEEAVVATNTSTLPISEIADAAEHPERVLGMHFFSPVHKMPLLEIIRTDETRDEALATALEVGHRLGKTCIVVDDGPGFFTSRVIGAYINEAGWILQEGASVEAIDEAMKNFGFPVGPMKLVDEVGFDVAVKAADTLQTAFSERWDAPTTLETLADQGRKGRKNEWGFYRYEEGEATEIDPSVYDLLPGGPDRKSVDHELVRERCWLAMLNECAYCLQEDVARRPRDVDVGVVFGLGFPPFRGGVLRHADAVGIETVVRKLERLADEYGDRLRPAPLLKQKARRDETFYD
jgi:3-hydroxyacyl-CoA dehydrogenase/enoyl-CoA hydratase/3-hydroxybutyryl-CoA epimerase